MEQLNLANEWLLRGSMVVLAVAILVCLIRALLGPRFTDRIIAVNLIGTKTIILICMISLLLKESNLVDVALVYALISFLAVVVLVNIYLTVHNEREAELEEKEMEFENDTEKEDEAC